MWLVIAAWVASLLVFSTDFMKTMIPLRVVGIASNVAFMSYALVGLAYGVFGRLYPILALHACLLPLNIFRLRQVRGRVSVRRGGPHRSARHALADRRVPRRLPAVDDHEGKALELYYQNPTFGMFLLRLLSGYALDHAVAGGRTSPGPGGRGPSASGASKSSRWSDVEDSQPVESVLGLNRRTSSPLVLAALGAQCERAGRVRVLDVVVRDLGSTSTYLQDIDPDEIITAVRGRRAPMMSAGAGLNART